MELRRQAKAQQSLRELAEKAETSRVYQLQGVLEGGLDRLAAQIESAEARLNDRLDRMAQEQSHYVAESANGLAAALAELDQRIETQRRGAS
jgi:DNA anti-recombination protein RmuC